jgi:hypothetical protein
MTDGKGVLLLKELSQAIETARYAAASSAVS